MSREIKLFDSELKVMEQLWAHGEMKAKDLAKKLAEEVGWKKTTTYTIIKKCVDKGAIERKEPNFVCKPLISKEQVREYEIEEIIERYYEGATDKLVVSLLSNRTLSHKLIQKLKEIVSQFESGENDDN